MISVCVKVLSGEVISLDIPEGMTNRQFYGQVYYDLPEEVAPPEDYQMTILRTQTLWEDGEENEEHEELLANDEVFEAEDGEMFFAVMDSATYEFHLNPTWWDAYERTRPMNYLFDANEYTICREVGGVKETVRKELFFHGTDHEDSWYPSEDVKTEWGGRFGDELALDIPEDAIVYGSLRAMALVLLERSGLSKRVQVHLLSEWLNQWNYYRNPVEEEEDEDVEVVVPLDENGEEAAWPVAVEREW